MTDLSLPRLSELRGAPSKILGLTKYLKALALAKGDPVQAEVIAASRWPSEQRIGAALREKTAVVSGGRNQWGAELSAYDQLAAEFAAAVRAASVLGRLANTRRVPLMISVPRATAGTSAAWLSEGAPIPMSSMTFDSTSLAPCQLGGLAAVSAELARASTPGAEGLLQADLIAACAAFTDTALLDPAYAAVANKNPASITNGVTAISSTGVTAAQVAADLRSAINAIITAGGQLSSPVWIMPPRIAMALGLLRDTSGGPAFPGAGLGGQLGGAPIISSSAVPSSVSGGAAIVLLDQAELMAAEGELNVDVSQEASLQFTTVPGAGAQQQVSLWQNNLVGIRAVRTITWAPCHAAAMTAAWIDGVML